MRHRVRRDERGQIAGAEGAVFGVLLFVIGSLVIANGWAVVDARTAVGAAAREAVRAFTEAHDVSTGEAMEEARAAAEATIAGHGRDPSQMVLEAEEAELARCARVTFRVEYPVPMISLPVIGRHGRGFTATARHSEIVDPFRSGLPTSAQCPPELQP